MFLLLCVFFFFQAEDGIRDSSVTGVQTCALPIYKDGDFKTASLDLGKQLTITDDGPSIAVNAAGEPSLALSEIGRGAWRGRGEISGVAGSFKKKKKKKDGKCEIDKPQ